MKEISLHIQEAYQTPSWISSKKFTPEHIMISKKSQRQHMREREKDEA